MNTNRLRLLAEDLHSATGHNPYAKALSQAADMIEMLRSNIAAIEDEKNTYMDYVGDALGQDHDGETLWDAAQRVLSERDSLRAELETERMRLVACSVIALANTPESAASARDMHPDYQSPYCDDVARAIDREIALRAELAECKRDAERYRWLRRARMNVDVLVREDEDSVWLDMHGWDLDAYVDAALAAKGEAD